MPRIRFKDNVRIKVLTPALSWILHVLDSMRRFDDLPSEIVITSGNDSTHSPNSRHYKDEALDIRSKNFAPEQKERFRKLLESSLNSYPEDPGKFLVLLEDLGGDNEHFHVQVKKNETFY